MAFFKSTCIESGSKFQPVGENVKVSFFDADSKEQDNHFEMRCVFVRSTLLFKWNIYVKAET